jgi:4-hydroxybenzoate polyprenyltransferase
LKESSRNDLGVKPLLNIGILVLPLILGLVFGYVLRGKKRSNFDKVSLGVILVLIFSLGFTIGANNELLEAMPRVGLNATVIMLFAVLFSVVFVKIAKKAVRLE